MCCLLPNQSSYSTRTKARAGGLESILESSATIITEGFDGVIRARYGIEAGLGGNMDVRWWAGA